VSGASAAGASPRAVTVFAPAGVGNVAVGFDILGHAVQGVGDRVTVRRIPEREVRIAGISGLDEELPTTAAHNTATAGLVALRRERRLEFGFEVSIDKGIPLGSGMGGSAASAVGAIVAASALLPEPLGVAEMFRYALVGETVASGTAHGDNLAPGLLGGLTLVRGTEPPDLVRVPVPAELRCVLVHPHLRLDTRVARAVLAAEVPLKKHIEQSANLAGLLVGCLQGDLALIGRSLADVIVEPRREALVPGFAGVKRAALQSGALGCSISGAGPSLFAWCADDSAAERARGAMVEAFAAAGLAADGWISPVDGPGARIVETA
jgi:homoserine kinase